MKILNNILKGFHWDNIQALGTSIIPSTKYHMTLMVITLSAVASAMEHLLGLSYMTVVAFLVLMLMEVLTGVYASVAVNKEAFQSSKMGRFGVKVFIILIVLFITHTFNVDFKDKSPILSELFEWLWSFLFGWFSLEYLFSVIENYGTIKGKNTNELIKSIKDKFNLLFGISPVILLLFCSIFCSSCSRKTISARTDVSKVQKDSVVIVERLSVDTIRIKGDSILQRIIINCDSLGHVIPFEASSTSQRAKSKVSVNSKGLLTVECNCDKWEQLVYKKESEMLKMKQQIESSKKESLTVKEIVITPKWAYRCLWIIIAEVVCIALYVAWKIYFKIQKPI